MASSTKLVTNNKTIDTNINTSNHILDKLAYSIKEFQHISGLGRTTIYKAISIDKTLKVIKIGRRTLIPKQSVIDFLS